MSSPVTFTSAGSQPPAAYGSGEPAPNNLQRALLEVRKPPQSGGTGQPGAKMFEIKFQFNPKELSLTKNAKWGRDPQRNAKKSGPPEFKGSDPCKLALEMFLDATDKMDDAVVKKVEQLFTCCVATEESRQHGKGSPPWVIFKWGGMTGFPAYVAGVTAKYTLFTPSGTPVRAVCTVNLEEIAGELSGQNPTSGALAARDTHVFVAGDSLQAVAFRAYGDAAKWREIADANDIDDPMWLRPGTRLLVPALEELDG
ncbi:LysM peptidoglycan-binding domain-containing protein [Amycolatopsis umgeniensis]|uniref:Nucleoid-associated protein YgaU n=1 Tax=Amycolatopsis umgeniensis TaxID=336628 RepID=A0A841BFV2_9PSEU|nr:LysM peptidoglycan-binding domain-containing protein [Amycolatopsis umgeniensis]MBB5857583.1 nucleoid-associated protein YgaU [Amycolatopsis umgeniensis]